jgi:hypothetical protein
MKTFADRVRDAGTQYVDMWQPEFVGHRPSRQERIEGTRKRLAGARSCDVSSLRNALIKGYLEKYDVTQVYDLPATEYAEMNAKMLDRVNHLPIPTKKRCYVALRANRLPYMAVVDPIPPAPEGDAFVGFILDVSDTEGKKDGTAAYPVGYLIGSHGVRPVITQYLEEKMPELVEEARGGFDGDQLSLVLAGLIADAGIGIGARADTPIPKKRTQGNSFPIADERFALYEPENFDKGTRGQCLHWVIGHHTDYTKENGGRLFGKYECRVWIPGHWAGDPRRGIVMDRLPCDDENEQ